MKVIYASALIFLLASCSANNQESETTTVDEAASSPAPGAPPYTLPPANVETLVNDVSATRTKVGWIVISGETLLPQGTKLWIERRSHSGSSAAHVETFVDDSGRFSAGPLSDPGAPPKEGPQQIGIVAHFNGAWQPDSVLSITGRGGINFPPATLVADDPEFPNASRHLDESRTVLFPPIPGDVAAINSVKTAKLYVQGQGQAIDSVGEIVGVYESMGIKPLGWSAEESGNKWIVTLDSEDNTGRRKAQWEFDPASGKVRYLDPLSKIFSWMPHD